LRSRWSIPTVLLVVTIVVGAALGLEALQLLTPDRHARAMEALVKSLGGISGICAGPTGVLPVTPQADPARSLDLS
jgi:hypothetical protein